MQELVNPPKGFCKKDAVRTGCIVYAEDSPVCASIDADPWAMISQACLVPRSDC